MLSNEARKRLADYYFSQFNEAKIKSNTKQLSEKDRRKELYKVFAKLIKASFTEKYPIRLADVCDIACRISLTENKGEDIANIIAAELTVFEYCQFTMALLKTWLNADLANANESINAEDKPPLRGQHLAANLLKIQLDVFLKEWWAKYFEPILKEAIAIAAKFKDDSNVWFNQQFQQAVIELFTKLIKLCTDEKVLLELPEPIKLNLYSIYFLLTRREQKKISGEKTFSSVFEAADKTRREALQFVAASYLFLRIINAKLMLSTPEVSDRKQQITLEQIIKQGLMVPLQKFTKLTNTEAKPAASERAMPSQHGLADFHIKVMQDVCPQYTQPILDSLFKVCTTEPKLKLDQKRNIFGIKTDKQVSLEDQATISVFEEEIKKNKEEIRRQTRGQELNPLILNNPFLAAIAAADEEDFLLALKEAEKSSQPIYLFRQLEESYISFLPIIIKLSEMNSDFLKLAQKINSILLPLSNPEAGTKNTKAFLTEANLSVEKIQEMARSLTELATNSANPCSLANEANKVKRILLVYLLDFLLYTKKRIEDFTPEAIDLAQIPYHIKAHLKAICYFKQSLSLIYKEPDKAFELIHQAITVDQETMIFILSRLLETNNKIDLLTSTEKLMQLPDIELSDTENLSDAMLLAKILITRIYQLTARFERFDKEKLKERLAQLKEKFAKTVVEYEKKSALFGEMPESTEATKMQSYSKEILLLIAERDALKIEIEFTEKMLSYISVLMNKKELENSASKSPMSSRTKQDEIAALQEQLQMNYVNVEPYLKQQKKEYIELLRKIIGANIPRISPALANNFMQEKTSVAIARQRSLTTSGNIATNPQFSVLLQQLQNSETGLDPENEELLRALNAESESVATPLKSETNQQVQKPATASTSASPKSVTAQGKRLSLLGFLTSGDKKSLSSTSGNNPVLKAPAKPMPKNS